MTDAEPKGCLFALLEILGLASRSAESTSVELLPYRRKEYLLTKAEHAFFEVLHPLVDKHMHLFVMVRLADLVYIARGIEKTSIVF